MRSINALIVYLVIVHCGSHKNDADALSLLLEFYDSFSHDSIGNSGGSRGGMRMCDQQIYSPFSSDEVLGSSQGGAMIPTPLFCQLKYLSLKSYSRLECEINCSANWYHLWDSL